MATNGLHLPVPRELAINTNHPNAATVRVDLDQADNSNGGLRRSKRQRHSPRNLSDADVHVDVGNGRKNKRSKPTPTPPDLATSLHEDRRQTNGRLDVSKRADRSHECRIPTTNDQGKEKEALTHTSDPSAGHTLHNLLIPGGEMTLAAQILLDLSAQSQRKAFPSFSAEADGPRWVTDRLTLKISQNFSRKVRLHGLLADSSSGSTATTDGTTVQNACDPKKKSRSGKGSPSTSPEASGSQTNSKQSSARRASGRKLSRGQLIKDAQYDAYGTVRFETDTAAAPANAQSQLEWHEQAQKIPTLRKALEGAWRERLQRQELEVKERDLRVLNQSKTFEKHDSWCLAQERVAIRRAAEVIADEFAMYSGDTTEDEEDLGTSSAEDIVKLDQGRYGNDERK